MCMSAKSHQSCPTLCDPVNCSPPGSPVHGIFQARVLEWVAMSSCRGSSWPRDWTCIPYVLEKEMATHSSTLAWRIPWMEEPGRRQFTGSQRVGHDWATSLSFYSSFWRRKWPLTPAFLPGESHGRRGLVGYSLWGCKELDPTKQLTHTHTHTHTHLLPPTLGGRFFTTSTTWEAQIIMDQLSIIMCQGNK